jgi:hypothetical protein
MIAAQTVILPARVCAPVAPKREFDPLDPPMPKAPSLLESWIRTKTIKIRAAKICRIPMKFVIF